MPLVTLPFLTIGEVLNATIKHATREGKTQGIKLPRG